MDFADYIHRACDCSAFGIEWPMSIAMHRAMKSEIAMDVLFSVTSSPESKDIHPHDAADRAAQIHYDSACRRMLSDMADVIALADKSEAA
jgi:hypothetical protein